MLNYSIITQLICQKDIFFGSTKAQTSQTGCEAMLQQLLLDILLFLKRACLQNCAITTLKNCM